MTAQTVRVSEGDEIVAAYAMGRTSDSFHNSIETKQATADVALLHRNNRETAIYAGPMDRAAYKALIAALRQAAHTAGGATVDLAQFVAA